MFFFVEKMSIPQAMEKKLPITFKNNDKDDLIAKTTKLVHNIFSNESYFLFLLVEFFLQQNNIDNTEDILLYIVFYNKFLDFNLMSFKEDILVEYQQKMVILLDQYLKNNSTKAEELSQMEFNKELQTKIHNNLKNRVDNLITIMSEKIKKRNSNFNLDKILFQEKSYKQKILKLLYLSIQLGELNYSLTKGFYDISIKKNISLKTFNNQKHFVSTHKINKINAYDINNFFIDKPQRQILSQSSLEMKLWYAFIIICLIAFVITLIARYYPPPEKSRNTLDQRLDDLMSEYKEYKKKLP